VNFTLKNIDQIKSRGITEEEVDRQLMLFKTGLPHINLKSAANIGDGICELSKAEKRIYVEHYNAKKDALAIMKFIPASGTV